MDELEGLFEGTSVTLADEFPCGFIDPETGEVHHDFVVEAMSGEAEDVLAGGGDRITRYNLLISLCIKSIGHHIDPNVISRAVSQMPSLDRAVALIAIRRATHGDVYNMIVPMPDDAGVDTKRYKIDLTSLKRTPMKEPDKRKRVDSLFLGPEGSEVEYKIHWHIMVANDEIWAERVQHVTTGNVRETVQILSRVDGITRVGKDGAPDVHVDIDRGAMMADATVMDSKLKAAVKLVQGFPAVLRRKIVAMIDDTEGDIDIVLDFNYRDRDGDQKSFKAIMDPTQRGFFFPRAT